MKILVTGGAGYIGSVITAELLHSGHEVTVIDDLRHGHRQAVPAGAGFVAADFCHSLRLDEVLRQDVETIVHLAGESLVGESMSDPGKFFDVNVTGGIVLLDAMRRCGVKNIVFSSTAAVYGEPLKIPIDESHPKFPVNAYGESKLMFEKVLDWYGRAYGIRHISLRYFNACGAAGGLGEDHRPETHLIPNILRRALQKNGNPVSLFGREYPTADGTCVRDYVHVSDIAQAHALALRKFGQPLPPQGHPHDIKESGQTYNLGSGGGYSVLQVVQAARRVTGAEIPVKDCPRRQGDPPVLVASAENAKKELGWNPRYTIIEEIIETAWQWLKDHPEGYGD